MLMYRAEDLADVMLHVNQIKEDARGEAERREQQMTGPQRKRAMEVVNGFIKAKGRPIIGGMALHYLAIQHDPGSEKVYPDDGPPADVDFYSPQPIQDIMDIADLLHKQGFKALRATEAVHVETYTVSLDEWRCCDASYMEKKIFDRVRAQAVNVDGFKVVHPHFMLIDSLRILNDPMFSYFRLDKLFPRTVRLQGMFPLPLPPHEPGAPRPPVPATTPATVASMMRTFVRGNRDVVLVGRLAARYYLAHTAAKAPGAADPLDTMLRQRTPPLSPEMPLELVTTAFKASAPRVMDLLLRDHAAERVSYKEYRPFYDFLGQRGDFLVDGVCVVRLLDHDNRCIPLVELPTPGDGAGGTERGGAFVQIGTFSVVVMYLMIMRFRLGVMEDGAASSRIQAAFDSLIYCMYRTRNTYLTLNGASVMDETPFQEFVLSCVGDVRSPRAVREEVGQAKFKRGIKRFNYDPSKPTKDFDRPDLYCNSSGRQVVNPQQMWYRRPA